MTDEEMIEARMRNGKSFTAGDLWRLPDLADHKAAYRLADRIIQRWRKRGWISFQRIGREVVWSLTYHGRLILAVEG